MEGNIVCACERNVSGMLLGLVLPGLRGGNIVERKRMFQMRRALNLLINQTRVGGGTCINNIFRYRFRVITWIYKREDNLLLIRQERMPILLLEYF